MLKHVLIQQSLRVIDGVAGARSLGSGSVFLFVSLDSKSEAFCSHVAVRSAKYLASASRVVVVSFKSPQ